MHRFYPDPVRSDETRFFLSPEDLHHAVNVLRLRPGNKAEVVFGGKRWTAEFISRNEETFLIPLEELASSEPSLSVTLFQGLPKGDKMDWIVQKAVELGVTRIIPVAFSRCIVKLAGKDLIRKQERCRRLQGRPESSPGGVSFRRFSLRLRFPRFRSFWGSVI